MTILNDARLAVRSLARSPGFAAVAIVTLALGIGVNAAVFSLTNSIVFKGFPFDDNDRILYMGLRNMNSPPQQRYGPVSYADFRDWRAEAKSFAGMAAASGLRINLSDQSGLPESYVGTQITANMFQLIGQKPVAGRDFMLEDERVGAAPVAILGYGLWERRYGKDRSVIGRAVRINGAPTTIVGVMPKDFIFPFNQDMWIPLIPKGADADKRELRNLVAFGRLADGVTAKAARAEIQGIARNLANAYPLTNQQFVPVVFNYNEFYIGPMVTTVFLAMLGAVGFVLLIACANVANLSLARTLGRSREISTRMALGSPRWHIIRRLLLESVILSLLGGLLGWAVAIWGTRAFGAAAHTMGAAAWLDFSMDHRALFYLLAISVATGLLSGLAPAMRLAHLNVNAALKDGGRGGSGGVKKRRLSNILVIAEVALAVVLVAAAGLMIRSFLAIYNADLGFKETNILTMRLALPANKYPKPDDQVSFHERLRSRLQAIPGVDAVSISNFLPTGGSLTLPCELEGALPADARTRPSLFGLVVSADYFRALNVPVLAGRSFTDTDGVSGPQVILVNQRFANKSWPNQDPVGKRLRLFDNTTSDGNAGGPWLTVVGVVPNIIQNNTSPKEIDPLIYLPYREKPQADMAIVARTKVPPGTLATAFRREIQALDSDLPIYNLWTLKERLDRNYWFYQVMGLMFTIFAGIALLLASVGLYAVLANAVTERTQEIGIRMASGATAGNIVRLVLKMGATQMTIGLAIGLAGAFAITRVLKAALVQVSANDPVTFVLAAVILVLAALIGCLIPAARATRVDPMVALRYE